MLEFAQSAIIGLLNTGVTLWLCGERRQHIIIEIYDGQFAGFEVQDNANQPRIG